MDQRPDVHPLLGAMEKFVSRKLKIILVTPQQHPQNILVAQLFCAVADADLPLIAELTEKIRIIDTAAWSQYTVPFILQPFSLLHYAAFSNDPRVMEHLFLHQDVVEKIVPVHPNAEASVPHYTTSVFLARNQKPSHADPSSLHYYTTFPDGTLMITPDSVAGATPLHVAAARLNVLTCRLLVACGGNVRAQRTCMCHLHTPAKPHSSLAPLSNPTSGLNTSIQSPSSLNVSYESAKSSHYHSEKTDERSHDALPAKRASTPLCDAIMAALWTAAGLYGQHLPTSSMDFENVLRREVLTYPRVISRELKRKTRHVETLAMFVTKQSPLSHPLFATVSFLLLCGADGTLLGCPPLSCPPAEHREATGSSAFDIQRLVPIPFTMANDAVALFRAFLGKIREEVASRSLFRYTILAPPTLEYVANRTAAGTL